MVRLFAAVIFFVSVALTFSADTAKPLNVLFLGDNGHHQPAARFAQLKSALGPRGIEIAYSDNAADLNDGTLAKYDGLIIYANTLIIEPPQEKALLDFVAGGKGFIPIHCASACFTNSPSYIELVGAQFKSHKTGDFSTKVADATHPIMKGFEPFTTWDETYVHDKHNPNRTVLQTRTEGDREEPWTWVRTHGKGRVFYTAYGHDERTWGNPGFVSLIERGVRWACGDDKVVESAANQTPAMTPKRTDVKPFEYTEANVPFYAPGGGGNKGGSAWNKMQAPVAPAESIKHLVVPEGFEAQLFASEPDILKPIAMAWDHRGRLWIAETVDYPNNKQPDGQGHDQIKICEDTDGDGKADKFTVFADKLSIPTSLTFANGGVIVHQAPETLFLKDTDGDDKADVRKVLFTGWSTGDTHAGPSNLHYGFDNWIWGIVGYAGFNGEVGGEKLAFSTGFYRFKSDGSKFEFLRKTNNNSWGVGFSEEGILFGSTANGNPSTYMPLPNHYYESVRGWSGTVLGTIASGLEFHPITDKVRQVDWHGRFTAAAGHALYTARTLPKEYWNRAAFVNEPTGHLSATFLIDKNGSDFISHNAWNIVASDDEWTAPIMTEVGPDGQLWVIDWYNYIIQHNPTPGGFKTGKGNAYEIPLRDKTHGRIYRLVYKGSKPYQPVKLDPNDGEGLVGALRNDNMFWRKTAQRLLVERAKQDVIPSLIKLTQDQGADEIGLNPAAIHALWALQGLGALDGTHPEATAAVLAALKHPTPGVRRNALQVVPRNEATFSAILSAGLLTDSDAQVRLAAFLAMAEMPRNEAAGRALAAAFDDPANSGDRWIPDAATSAAAAHDLSFLTAIATRKTVKPNDPKLLAIVSRVAEHYARGVPADSVGQLVASLASADPKSADAILSGLSSGWPKDAKVKIDDTSEKALVKLMVALPGGSKGQLVSLATRWGSTQLDKYTTEISAALIDKCKDQKESDLERVSAATQLIDLRRQDGDAAENVLKQITARSSPELSSGFLEALRHSGSAQAGAALVRTLPSLTPGIRKEALAILLGRADWTGIFVQAAENGKAQFSELSLDQKQSLAKHPNKAIADSAQKLLASGGGLPDADRQKVIDGLSPAVLQKGDAVKGKLVFQQNCTKCHTHSGEGAKIGPDLTGMAAHPKSELLIAIIDPSRSVEGNFRQYTVITDDGRVLVGLLSSETKTTIELLDSEGKVHPIQRENIKKFVASPLSLMPEGFEKQIGAEGLTNLLEFLTQRGRFMPLDLSKAATTVSTAGMFVNRADDSERLIFPDWTPKTFDGVPFTLVDPKGDKVPNAIMLNGSEGPFAPAMPKSVPLPCNSPAKAIHLLSGVSGWGFAGGTPSGSVSMIVRLHYAGGKTEDHPLKDGIHFADYIRQVDVPESKLAFKLRNQQIRYLSIHPKLKDSILEIELVKGPDHTAPVVMAVTVEAID